MRKKVNNKQKIKNESNENKEKEIEKEIGITTITTTATTTTTTIQINPISQTQPLSSAQIHLIGVEPRFRDLIEKHGHPSFIGPIPLHESGSSHNALCRIVVFQQLSTAAARTIWNRLQDVCSGSITPKIILDLETEKLRSAGLSARKVEYLKNVSTQFQSGSLSDSNLKSMNEEQISTTLRSIKGFGPWSVDIFRMFYLLHDDVLPLGDLGLKKGIAKFFGLSSTKLPSPNEIEKLTFKWKPYRSVAVWYMWRLLDTQNKEIKPKKTTKK